MRSPFRNISNLMPLIRGRLPGQLIIQYSNRCNADCPQCGMRRSEQISRYTLDKAHAKKLIDSAAANGVRSLSLTGGEPLMFLDDIVELTNHASRAGIPYVRTGTNGFIFTNSDAPDYQDRISRITEKLASTPLYTFWISMDSANPASHERMRGLNGVVTGIEKALPIFHDHGIYPAVNLGINRATGSGHRQPFLSAMGQNGFLQTFRESFESFYRFAANLGFTMANACYPMSEGSDGEREHAGDAPDSTYGAISSDTVITFSRREKSLIFQALFDTIPKFRGTLRIFSPRCSLYSLIKKYQVGQPFLFPCRGGTDFFFVECREGMIHPCGYLDDPKDELPFLGKRFGTVVNCEKCEWECFRDPSDVLGPFADFFSHPFKLLAKVMREPQFFRLLKEDLSYYKACGFFNGRLAPRTSAMLRFQRS
ncbi:MAG: radical SAM protein [Desulfofustis sp.]|nr:radical SAM protein [Desulfofustis sp.]